MTSYKTDIEIIKAVARGDAKACDVVVKRFGRIMFDIIVRMVRDRRDAEELTQDALLKGIRKIDSYDPECASLKTWLCSIAYRTALSHLRRSTFETVAMTEETVIYKGVTEYDSIQEMDDSRVEQLQRALRRLSEEEQMLVTLFYYENMSLADIAYITATTTNALGVRICRIRRKLYNMIK